METSQARKGEAEVLKESSQTRKQPLPAHKKLSPVDEVKLAAMAISLNVRLRSSDMPLQMQALAIHRARSLLDSAPNHKPNLTHLARALKKEFDSVYGPAWHCVVGTSFGSFVTHSSGGFMYFSIDSFSVLIFQTKVFLITELEPLRE